MTQKFSQAVSKIETAKDSEDAFEFAVQFLSSASAKETNDVDAKRFLLSVETKLKKQDPSLYEITLKTARRTSHAFESAANQQAIEDAIEQTDNPYFFRMRMAETLPELRDHTVKALETTLIPDILAEPFLQLIEARCRRLRATPQQHMQLLQLTIDGSVPPHDSDPKNKLLYELAHAKNAKLTTEVELKAATAKHCEPNIS